MLNLAAIKDRGLNPTFEDVIAGIDAALHLQKGGDDAEESELIRHIEDACRKRNAENEKALKTLRERGMAAYSDFILRDKTGQPVQLQNPSP